jgi:hypothetical protein
LTSPDGKIHFAGAPICRDIAAKAQKIREHHLEK